MRQAHLLRSLHKLLITFKNDSEWNCLYCILSVAVVISQCEKKKKKIQG